MVSMAMGIRSYSKTGSAALPPHMGVGLIAHCPPFERGRG